MPLKLPFPVVGTAEQPGPNGAEAVDAVATGAAGEAAAAFEADAFVPLLLLQAAPLRAIPAATAPMTSTRVFCMMNLLVMMKVTLR
jgi:hypothetical protein